MKQLHKNIIFVPFLFTFFSFFFKKKIFAYTFLQPPCWPFQKMIFGSKTGFLKRTKYYYSKRKENTIFATNLVLFKNKVGSKILFLKKPNDIF